VIESEVDRVYLDTEADCLIEDRGLKRQIRIARAAAAPPWCGIPG